MDRRRSHARYTAAWRLACFAGSLGIMYFAVGQLMADGDIGVPRGITRRSIGADEALPDSSESSGVSGGRVDDRTGDSSTDAARPGGDAAQAEVTQTVDQQQAALEHQQLQEQDAQQQHDPQEGVLPQQEAAQQQQQHAGEEATCHAEEHAEYDGDLVNWGHSVLQDSTDACCDLCKANPRCNIWVFCPLEAGCGPGLPHRECWLKHLVAQPPDLAHVPGKRGPDVPWTSGAVFPDSQREATEQRIAAENAAEQQRLLDLKKCQHLPLVYMDVEIKGEAVGRMVFVLFPDEAPRAAENYRQLFTGEKGIVPEGHEGAGKPYHLKGTSFYRIIDRFIDQGGADTDSVFGGAFKDDPGGLKLQHDRKGLLSIANSGPEINDSHFSIMMGPEPHNDGHYTVFGELVEGWDVAVRINQLSIGKPDNTAGRDEGAVIVDAGQLRSGDPIQLPEVNKEATAK